MTSNKVTRHQLVTEYIMISNSSSNESNAGKRSGPPASSATPASGQEYKVGWGRPPKEFPIQARPKRKSEGRQAEAPSLLPNLKRLAPVLAKVER
jgi:hypothetical protein